MKIEKSVLEALYALYDERLKYDIEHMDYSLTDEKRALDAYYKSVEIDRQITNKVGEIVDSFGISIGLFACKLLKAVFPKSISMYLKCLEVCGVEVYED
jgi:hypothetical protein